MTSNHTRYLRHTSLTANCRRLFGISQGDNTWIVNPLSNNQTCEEFFNFDDWESHTGLEQSDTSLIFLWDGPDGLSLVIIHDTWEDDGSGGAVRFEFIGLPGEGSWVVQNDPDNFDSATDTDVQWSWSADHNDGGVFRGGLDGTFEITIVPGFNVGIPLDPGEITTWKLVSGDLSSPTQYVLDMSENLTISDSISA